jgi:hypothetical protein
MKPFRYDNDVAVFTTRDIDDYGMPELYGYTKYIVIESRDLNLVTDWKTEQHADLRPIHRYSRLARFKSTLLNILGETGVVPDYCLTIIKTYLNPESVDLWNDTRKLLKHFKQVKMYDRIPCILSRLGYGRSYKSLTGQKIDDIIDDFKLLNDRFERTKEQYNRRYFPNIRFVVFKLLQYHGISMNYPIPFIRTSRKLRDLEKLWKELVE